MPYPKMIDDKIAEKLYLNGFSDYTIAGVFNISSQSICAWRKKRNLPAVGKPGRTFLSSAQMIEKATEEANTIQQESTIQEKKERKILPGETRNQRCRRCIERNGKCEYSGIKEICHDCGCYWEG